MIRLEIEKQFENVVTVPELVERSSTALNKEGYFSDQTIFSDCFCRDEINQKTVDKFSAVWGENFRLAGLAGLPTSGLTGMAALTSHMPTDGRQFFVFGPHIAIDSEGSWGLAERMNVEKSTVACGSLAAAIDQVWAEGSENSSLDPDLDLEQNIVVKALQNMKRAGDPQPSLLEVTCQMVNVIGESLERLIQFQKTDFAYAFLGGVLINTPVNEPEYFAPVHFHSVSSRRSPAPIKDLLFSL